MCVRSSMTTIPRNKKKWIFFIISMWLDKAFSHVLTREFIWLRSARQQTPLRCRTRIDKGYVESSARSLSLILLPPHDGDSCNRKVSFIHSVDIDKTKNKKKSEQLSFQARVWTLLSPTSNIPLVLDNSNHHGAFSFSSSSFGCCYVNGGEHNGNGWKTKVKKNKVRERSMRREHVAHFQWVACGDIDLFIHEKYDEASEPSHVLVREIGKLCLACMRVEPEKMQKEISRIISCW